MSKLGFILRKIGYYLIQKDPLFLGSAQKKLSKILPRRLSKVAPLLRCYPIYSHVKYVVVMRFK